jgi:hypothetical protein
VTFGFYTKKKPTIQLLVNGEPCVSAVNSNTGVVYHSTSSSSITGITLKDFLSLPSQSRLSISFSGDGAAEGFLALKKL